MPLHFRDGDIHYLARMTLDLTDEEADALTPPSPRCDRLRPIPVRAAARSAQGDPHKARSAGAAAETSASAAAGRGAGLAACQKGLSVGFITAAAVVHELIEARDEKRLLRLQRQIAGYKLLIIDELGYVPLSTTGAELLFEIFSQRYERGSTLVTSNLPFDEWTGVFGSERLTAALLDCLTHHVNILEMNGDSIASNRASNASARRKSSRQSVCHGAHCGEGPVLAMLAVLGVAPLLPSPTLRAVAR